MKKRTTNKLFALLLALVMVLAMAVPAMAVTADTNREEITKTEYDAFDGKLSANNSAVDVGNGFTLHSDSKDGWRIVADDDVFGTIEVAYKIGKAYYVVTFEIRKESREYFIGDGSGKNGVNHVKIGEFVKHECGDDWETTDYLAPNCVEAGYEEKTCTWCGNIETITLDKDPNNHKLPVTCEVCNVCDACGVCKCKEEAPEATAMAYAYKGNGNNNFLVIEIYSDGELVAKYEGNYSQSEVSAEGFERTFDGYTVLIVVKGRGGGSGSDENYLEYPLNGTATITDWPE